MTNTSHKSDEILITDDVLSRYKISRSTLYFWSTPSRMPSYVGIKPEADQPASQGDPAKQQASDADHPDNHAGYNVP